MNSNQKKFNYYVFLSTFARNLIEVFIGSILYKNGFLLKEVILYYLLVNIFSLVLSIPVVKFAKNNSNKTLAIFGIVCLVIVQFLLNTVVRTNLYLIVLALFFSLYRRCYWITRRYYNLKVMSKNNIASNYSFISIINQIGVIVSSYIGSLLLDYVSIKIVTIISMFIFMLSIFCLNGLSFEHEKNDEKLDLISTFKSIPKSNLYLFGTYELTNVVKFFIPLYLIIYVQDNYQTIGLLNLISNFATIIFAYLYGKKINNNNNYLSLSIILVVIVFFLKVNVPVKFLIIISFIEGITSKMHEISINKEFYSLSKKFEYYNYNLVYEFTQNVFRSIVLVIVYCFINDVRIMIYITLFIMLLGSLLKFKEVDKKDFEIK